MIPEPFLITNPLPLQELILGEPSSWELPEINEGFFALHELVAEPIKPLPKVIFYISSEKSLNYNGSKNLRSSVIDRN